MNRVKLFTGVWFAGYVAGIATLYLGGPALGYRLRASGDRLAAMDGSTQLHTAAEVDAVVADAVTRYATVALRGRK